MRTGSTTASLFLLVLVGCAAPRMAGIPLGHWSGSGEFIAVPSGDAATQPASPDARRYSTTLDIQRGTGPASGRIVFEIHSARGEIEGLDGDRTHLIFELEPAALVEAGRARTYRIARAGVSGNETPPTLEDGPKNTTNAIGVSGGGEFVLYISYQVGEWHDVFRFRGDRLSKTGALESSSHGHFDHDVFWFEELTRHQP